MTPVDVLESQTEANDPKVDMYGNPVVRIRDFNELPQQKMWNPTLIYALKREGDGKGDEHYFFYGDGRCIITTKQKGEQSVRGGLEHEVIDSDQILKLRPRIEKFDKLKATLSSLSESGGIKYPVGNNTIIYIASPENKIGIVKHRNSNTETTNDDSETVVTLEFSKGKFYTSEKYGNNKIELKKSSEIEAMFDRINLRVNEYKKYKENERLKQENERVKKEKIRIKYAQNDKRSAEKDLEKNLNLA